MHSSMSRYSVMIIINVAKMGRPSEQIVIYRKYSGCPITLLRPAETLLTIHIALVLNFGWSKTAISITNEALSVADVKSDFVSRCEIQYRTRE